ncbi:hypothetical protein [Streptomyces beihaiensis]|uniref:Sporulation protein YjcZ n=1 Tax=Streptomyces beihaiensis TaxID=2984495 RepID=A0ABT3TXI6_9ACTN|nr:hypothetical protein [Streptomyces beihaiensis]MCX3061758.1 hypothetical protein [Streptomyces beihaiensis]
MTFLQVHTDVAARGYHHHFFHHSYHHSHHHYGSGSGGSGDIGPWFWLVVIFLVALCVWLAVRGRNGGRD